MDAGIFQGCLDVIEHVLSLKHFRVAPEQPSQQILAGPAGTDRDLAERCLERLVVSEASSPERLFDRVVQVVGLELTDLPGTISPYSGHPQDLAFADPGAEEDGDGGDELIVLFPNQLVRFGPRKAERHIDALQHRKRNSDLLAENLKRPIRPRRSSATDLDVSEREITGRVCLADRFRVDPHAVQVKHDARPQDRACRISLAFRLEDPEFGEPPDGLRCGPDSLGDLRFSEPLATHAAGRTQGLSETIRPRRGSGPR